MISFTVTKARNIATAGGFAVLAACAAPPPPPPPPPAPVAIPSRPQPPSGAAANMAIPPVGPDGMRQTVNAHISEAQRVWNFRSAYNVAALNCLQPKHAGILEGYKHFLSNYERDLSRTNKAVENEWRHNEGSGYKRARDTYTTQVYNYWALPPVLPQFCDAVLQISQQEAVAPSPSLDAFADQAMAKLQTVFDEFYSAFERYRVDVADWDARYGPTYGYSQVQYTNATYAGPMSPNTP
ncbi:MAG: hypothetical protein PHE36_09765 [Novosphingobium sp.]|nr:hypothetical protein [Novosphingobium sp.]